MLQLIVQLDTVILLLIPQVKVYLLFDGAVTTFPTKSIVQIVVKHAKETVVNLISDHALEPAVSPIFATVPQVSWPRNLLFVV